MANFDDVRRKFSNHRQWRDFIAAVHESVTSQCSVTYPMVLSALRSGRAWFNDGALRSSRAWFNDGAERASSWLDGAAQASKWLSSRSGVQRQSLGV
jgi:hypothetical protein